MFGIETCWRIQRHKATGKNQEFGRMGRTGMFWACETAANETANEKKRGMLGDVIRRVCVLDSAESIPNSAKSSMESYHEQMATTKNRKKHL